MNEQTVFIVDDDDGSLNSMAWLVQSLRFNVETFSSASEFLESFDPQRPGCIVLDVRMPGLSGLCLQETLTGLDYCPPIIFVSGHGDVPMSVRAIKAGAVDFLEKPVNDQIFLDLINEAIQLDAKARQMQDRAPDVKQLLSRLTPREAEVMNEIVSGKTLKQIAAEFQISFQTASKHRIQVLEKLNVANDVELVRLVLGLPVTEKVTFCS